MAMGKSEYRAIFNSFRNHGAIRSHRCEGSLAARVPIRYARRHSNDTERRWVLFDVVNDFDSFTVLLRPVTPIRYCPFCGKELKEVDDA